MHHPASKPELEQRFWQGVKSLLNTKFGHRPSIAQHGIDDYKRSIGGADSGLWGIPEVVYNQGEEKIAEAVDGIIKTGLPTVARRPA